MSRTTEKYSQCLLKTYLRCSVQIAVTSVHWRNISCSTRSKLTQCCDLRLTGAGMTRMRCAATMPPSGTKRARYALAQSFVWSRCTSMTFSLLFSWATMSTTCCSSSKKPRMKAMSRSARPTGLCFRLMPRSSRRMGILPSTLWCSKPSRSCDRCRFTRLSRPYFLKKNWCTTSLKLRISPPVPRASRSASILLRKICIATLMTDLSVGTRRVSGKAVMSWRSS
mmetsp:Transcript_31272/g.99358  ORF Transcript_31272/g.99358 Transcript_31272/m.99358 type:complete len:224 (-) Transcript_31272:1046-1717(-)